MGNYCVFAGQTGVVGHITVGDGAQIGAQAGVTNDVPAGTQMWGTPAIPLTDAKRAYGSISRLPEMRKEIRRLQKQLEQLQAQVNQGAQPGEATS